MSPQMTGAQPSPAEKSAGIGCFAYSLAFIFLLLSPLIIYLVLVAVGGILIVADPIVPVDSIVILSGDSGDRLAMAADMLKRGYANTLLITNTDHAANRLLTSEAEALGFDNSRIFITDRAVDSTRDEARAVKQFAEDHGWSAFMVVTDPYHSFRTRLIFQHELRGSGVTISVRPVVGHWFKSSTWFFSCEGWQAVFLEIAKLINYLIFHI
ncbi:MAG TPA: YdcF family protein [Brevefilum sp.]|nr:YdcF family protein [Brevefilum sp.]